MRNKYSSYKVWKHSVQIPKQTASIFQFQEKTQLYQDYKSQFTPRSVEFEKLFVSAVSACNWVYILAETALLQAQISKTGKAH